MRVPDNDDKYNEPSSRPHAPVGRPLTFLYRSGGSILQCLGQNVVYIRAATAPPRLARFSPLSLLLACTCTVLVWCDAPYLLQQHGEATDCLTSPRCRVAKTMNEGWIDHVTRVRDYAWDSCCLVQFVRLKISIILYWALFFLRPAWLSMKRATWHNRRCIRLFLFCCTGAYNDSSTGTYGDFSTGRLVSEDKSG